MCVPDMVCAQVGRLSSLWMCACNGVRRVQLSTAEGSGGGGAADDGSCDGVLPGAVHDASVVADALVGFTVAHLEVEQVSLWPLLLHAITVNNMLRISRSTASEPIASAARSIAARIDTHELAAPAGAGAGAAGGGGRDRGFGPAGDSLKQKYSAVLRGEVSAASSAAAARGSGARRGGGVDLSAGGSRASAAHGAGEDGASAVGLGSMSGTPLCPLLLGSRGVSGGPQDRKNRLRWLQLLAEARGGEFLGSEYVGTRKRVPWRCAAGHEWLAPPDNVIRGSWCAVCARAARRLTLADMNATAARFGGKCLSRRYEGLSVKLLWECSEGHQFWLAPNNVRRPATSRRRPSWCPHCGPARGRTAYKSLAKPVKPKRGDTGVTDDGGVSRSAKGKRLGRPPGARNRRKPVLLSKPLGETLVRAGVEEALKNKLDDEALAALDFLVNRYFVRPSNRADAPKDILLQVIASVNDEMGID